VRKTLERSGTKPLDFENITFWRASQNCTRCAQYLHIRRYEIHRESRISRSALESPVVSAFRAIKRERGMEKKSCNAAVYIFIRPRRFGYSIIQISFCGDETAECNLYRDTSRRHCATVVATRAIFSHTWEIPFIEKRGKAALIDSTSRSARIIESMTLLLARCCA